MRNFLMNWNYKKHAVSVSSIFFGLFILGNSFFGKPVPKDEKSYCPMTLCKQMTNKQHVFNGMLAVAYALKMTLGFFVVDHWKKQYK